MIEVLGAGRTSDGDGCTLAWATGHELDAGISGSGVALEALGVVRQALVVVAVELVAVAAFAGAAAQPDAVGSVPGDADDRLTRTFTASILSLTGTGVAKAGFVIGFAGCSVGVDAIAVRTLTAASGLADAVETVPPVDRRGLASADHVDVHRRQGPPLRDRGCAHVRVALDPLHRLDHGLRDLGFTGQLNFADCTANAE